MFFFYFKTVIVRRVWVAFVSREGSLTLLQVSQVPGHLHLQGAEESLQLLVKGEIWIFQVETDRVFFFFFAEFQLDTDVAGWTSVLWVAKTSETVPFRGVYI